MRPSTANVLATGLVAGAIGFATVSTGFLLLDLVSGRGFGFTPSLLATALFQDLTQACDVHITGSAIAGYSALHLLVFLALGWLAAWLLALIAVRPWFWMGALFLFVIITFHLYGAVLAVLAPVQGCFSLYYVLGATAVAAMAMLGYLLKEHRGTLAIVSRSENQ
jgi:hypothetical protein